MCFGCWESAGKPRKLSNKARLLARYLPLAGTALHCVAGDWNLEDRDLAAAEDDVLRELDFPPGLTHAQAQMDKTILLMLADLPLAERYAAMAVADGYLTIKGNFTPFARALSAGPFDG